MMRMPELMVAKKTTVMKKMTRTKKIFNRLVPFCLVLQNCLTVNVRSLLVHC